jgi:hypothetical protein
MPSQGTAHGRFQKCAVHRGHVDAAEMAAREMGGLSLCELLANVDPRLAMRNNRSPLEAP